MNEAIKLAGRGRRRRAHLLRRKEFFSANLNISANFASHEGIFGRLGKGEKAFRRQMRARTLQLDMRYFNFEIPAEFRPLDAHHSLGQSAFPLLPFNPPDHFQRQIFSLSLNLQLFLRSFQFIEAEDSHEERYTNVPT